MNVRRRGVGFLGRYAAACLAAVIAVSFASCGKLETTSTSPTGSSGMVDSQYTLSGTITSDGKGLEGVEVSSGNSSDLSDADGSYSISLESGTHSVVFEKDGYEDHTLSVSMGTQSTTTVDIEMTVGDGGSGGGGGDGETFTVTPGARIEYLVPGSGTLEFDITGMDHPNSEDKQHIAWGYEPGHEFTGGVGGSGGAEWGLRTYKIKVYEAGGDYVSEPRYNIDFEGSKTYHVVIEWSQSLVSADIDGTRVEVEGSYPNEWIVGIGWPPEVREGIDGATYSNIKWPDGSTPAN